MSAWQAWLAWRRAVRLTAEHDAETARLRAMGKWRGWPGKPEPPDGRVVREGSDVSVLARFAPK